ncbi:hypothetical protein AXF42_Ash014488 [Apostasia shenzhenica]|uniref:Cystatin domain-containing protein n=1 Tax=Apostasia shenzhenica TaxID=1088818 RepID=A0A2H9ZWM6_9ASPA|nr:hypothetical protein AXF42_Ash014488 [Apostasia shenzhenica]
MASAGRFLLPRAALLLLLLLLLVLLLRSSAAQPASSILPALNLNPASARIGVYAMNLAINEYNNARDIPYPLRSPVLIECLQMVQGRETWITLEALVRQHGQLVFAKFIIILTDGFYRVYPVVPFRRLVHPH